MRSVKNYLLIIFIVCSIVGNAQEPEGLKINDADTIDLYVINSSTRFISLPDEGNTKYSFFYRDLKYLKIIRELKFQSGSDVERFFSTCDKALETDKTFITQGYNVSRNRLGKNILRLNNKEGGYFLLKSASLEKMKSTFQKSKEK